MRASGIVSLTTHVMLVAAAVWATTEAHNLAPSTPVSFVEVAAPSGPTRGSEPPGIPTPTIDGRVDVPPIEPPAIGGSDFEATVLSFDMHPLSGPVLAPARSGSGEPIDVALAEELPMLLAGPVPAYPELLRQAGVQGRVMLEAVVDTGGHVEPGSIVVVAAAHLGFVAPARQAVAAMLFRPARVRGRAVRVRVRIPMDFALRR